jgi:hypothetical protein
VALRDHVIQTELIEQARLVSFLAPHHSQTLPLSLHQQESPFDAALNSFFDNIDPKRKWKLSLFAAFCFTTLRLHALGQAHRFFGAR